MTATERWLWAGVLTVAMVSGCGERRLVDADLPVPGAPPAWSPPIQPAARPVPAAPAQEEADRVPVRTLRLGQSRGGRELAATIFGAGERPVFIFGAIHGNEPASAAVAERLMDELRRDAGSCRACPVAILPAANPDGLAAGKRTNAAGVDLNRNFPARNWHKARPGSTYGGPSAASEPETRAIIRAVEQLQPRLIIAIHAITGGRQCNNYDGPAGAIGKAMAAHNGYPVTGTIGYPTPGSFGGWAGIDRQIPVITLELPAGAGGEACWRDNRQALRAAILQSRRP